MTSAMPILAYQTGFSQDKLGMLQAGMPNYAKSRSVPILLQKLEHPEQEEPSRLHKNYSTHKTLLDQSYKLVKENVMLSLVSAATAAYAITHPLKAVSIVTALPRAIINIPKTWEYFMNIRPHVFLPHKPTLLETRMKLFKPLNIIKLGNMSLPDWTSRLMTLGLYIPQGYFAIKYQRQPYETWGRNVLVWISTFYLIMLSKNPSFPINQFFNQLFLPKQQLKRAKTIGQKLKLLLSPKKLLNELINPFRPDFNYLECFKKAGINLQKLGITGNLSQEVKKAPWSLLDLNELRQVKGYVDQLQMRYSVTSELRILGQKMKIERFLNNMLILNLVKSMTLALLTAYLIGIVVPYLVFRYISPLDKRFARPKMRYVVPPAELDKLKAMNTLPPNLPIKAEKMDG